MKTSELIKVLQNTVKASGDHEVQFVLDKEVYCEVEVSTGPKTEICNLGCEHTRTITYIALDMGS